MHREIRDRIEDVLSGTRVPQHLGECRECREEIAAMREQAALLGELRAPENLELEPRAGFYARVLRRIEAEGPVSIWNLFIESAFGRRIAVASLALALLLGIYVVSSERAAQDPFLAGQQTPIVAGGSLAVAGEDAPGRVITQMDQSADDSPSSADAVLANLVTYHEQ
jgi:anti-sigma factor RsiW